jgi:hypothetical protein
LVREGRGRLRSSIFSFWVLVVTAFFCVVPAIAPEAALTFPARGEILGTPLGPFGQLSSESVAVNDFNNHILIADSSLGDIYDFESPASTPTTWNGSTTPSKSFGEHSVAVAADNTTGDVYVADTTHLVIDKLNPSGEPIKTFGDSPKPNGQLAGTTTPAGSFSHPGTFTPLAITIDQTTHNLYVIDSGHEVIDTFDENGKYLKQITEKPGRLYCLEGKYTDGIAVRASNGHVFVSDSCVLETFEFDPTGNIVAAWNGNNSPLEPGSHTPAGSFGESFTSVATENVSGRVFIADTFHSVLDAFDSVGNYLGRISGIYANSPVGGGVSVGQSTGDVYVSDNSSHSVKIFGVLVVPDVTNEKPLNSLLTSALFRASLNPDAAGNATCRFIWGPPGELGHVAACPGEVANGNAPVGVQVEVTGLARDTTYCYRLQATNKNGTNQGEESQDQCFTTLGPGFQEEAVSEVTSDSASFRASIDPNSAPTFYFFQYGTGTGYGMSVPAAPGASIGAGKGTIGVGPQHAQGLQPHTLYHYRLVVLNEVTKGHVEEFDGPDHTFLTQPGGSELVLPDGRAWEMVSPPDKHGGTISAIEEGAVIQAAAGGTAITYPASAPVGGVPAGNAGGPQAFSRRGSDGWHSQTIAIPHEGAVGSAQGLGSEYRFFSEDISAGVVQPFGGFPLPSGPASLSGEASEQTAYLRMDYRNGNVNEPCVTGCYRPFVTGKPGYENVPSGDVFGVVGENRATCPPQVECGPRFVGGTPDLSHVVLQSDVALTEAPGDKGGLYEWANGRLVFLGAPKGSRPFDSVSRDGSRVVFTDGEVQKTLFMRDVVGGGGGTVQLDAVAPGCVVGCVSGGGVFRFASDDGSRVFLTSTHRLTSDAGAFDGGADLYECEMVVVAGALQCRLSDLTPLSGGEHAGVAGILGASGDGSWVYFVADGKLAAGAQRGACGTLNTTCNLFVRHGGVTRLVTVLSSEDEPDWQKALVDHPARVSPDGEWLAFMSERSLTGYDNHDAVSGQLDEEVYLYHASTGVLVCASCNPTGGRPAGTEYAHIHIGGGGIAGGSRVWGLSRWIAANVPGWTAYVKENVANALYQSRFLSDDGRLFFNSSDGLVPQDVNGTEDVYQFEPVGVGGCGVSDVTFSVGSGGCVGLISSGRGSGESAFLDASVSGGDVFFLTSAGLSAQDFDTSVDVYDARVCTVQSPCVGSSVVPPDCVTADACRVAPSVQPSIFGAPPSAVFSGAGNLSPPSLVKPRTAAQVRAERLVRALKACRAKGNRHKRVVCESQARKRYGPLHKAKKRPSHGAKRSVSVVKGRVR